MKRQRRGITGAIEGERWRKMEERSDRKGVMIYA
jgi:hypothetical protein